MGKAFTGQQQTSTAQHDMADDVKLPPLDNLNVSSLQDVTSLSGLTANEGSLVWGPRDQKLTGKETMHRTGDWLDNTVGDYTEHQTGTHDWKVDTDSLLLIGAQSATEIKGATNETYWGPRAQNFKAIKASQEPVSWLHRVKEHVEVGDTRMDVWAAYSLVAIAGNSSFVGNLDLRIADIALKAAICEHHGTTFWMKEEKADVSLMFQRVRMVETFAMVAEPGVGMAMMHEVAVTQEIFAVGANQAV